MSAMNNTETPGIATIKYKHTANRSNIKYQGWDAAGLREFSKIASLIKAQRNQLYRQEMEQNYKNHVKNKLNRKYNIITGPPVDKPASYIAYNDLLSDDDEPVSTEHYQELDNNHDIVESDGDECDISNDDIANQLNAST